MNGTVDAVEDEMDRFFARDTILPHVTAEAVADALQGFALQCRYSTQWLALAVRRALAATIQNASERPERQSNRDAKQELKKLASRAAKAWLAIQQRSDAADSAAWDYAFRNWRGVGSLADDDEADWNRFNAGLAELDWLSSFLRQAARSVGTQQPRWREAETREIRIERAQYLAPVYQTAFGMNELTGFGDFYQEMAALAFDEADIPDFEALISEVRRRHSQTPVSFAEGVIPAPY